MSEPTGWSEVPNWVLRDRTLRSSDKLVYIVLLNRTDGYKAVPVSLTELARDVGVTIVTVQKSVNHLEQLGLLEKQRRYGDNGTLLPNLYRVNADAIGDGLG